MRSKFLINEKLDELKRKGYELEFRRETTCIYCFQWEQYILPRNFSIDEWYYFEQIGGPDEDRILYAITLSQGTRGFLIEACNVYSDNISHELMHKLDIRKFDNNFIQLVDTKELSII